MKTLLLIALLSCYGFNSIIIAQVNDTVITDSASFYMQTDNKKMNEPDYFIDNRDGRKYKIINVGDQVWMAENLNFITPTNSFCFNYDINNCKLYGRLYIWSAAKEACPEGWHLPSDKEWKKLTDFIGGEATAGGKLKDVETNLWMKPNSEAKNSIGFSALPGSCRDQDDDFVDEGFYAYFWTSTELNRYSAISRCLSFQFQGITHDPYNKDFAFSVRCIKN